MISFIEYLVENIKFATGRDQDYTADHSSVVFLSPEDKTSYIENGKTHGIQSHGIKHLVEFRPSLVKQAADEVRSILKNAIENKTHDYLSLHNKRTGDSTLNNMGVATQASDGALLNVLDIINDKINNNKQLLPIERVLSKVINKIKNAYQEEIEKRIKIATDIDILDSVQDVLKVIESSKVIKFAVKSTMNMIYYLDLKDNVIIMSDNKQIRTMYKYNRAGSNYKQIINNFIAKSQRNTISYSSNYVIQAFNLIKKGQ